MEELAASVIAVVIIVGIAWLSYMPMIPEMVRAWSEHLRIGHAGNG